MQNNSEKKKNTCTNHSCNHVFEKPIKVLDLQKTSEGSYEACPFCFTRITAQNYSQIESSKEVSIEAKSEPDKKVSGCPYYLGYLGKQTSKGQFPDGCLTCKSLIECMLGK